MGSEPLCQVGRPPEDLAGGPAGSRRSTCGGDARSGRGIRCQPARHPSSTWLPRRNSGRLGNRGGGRHYRPAQSVQREAAGMKIDLAGKRAVSTGGSRGIGRAIALGCAEAGAAVSICARGADGLAPVREAIAAHGVRAHAQACDVADPAALEGYIAAAAEALGGIDILVCNASGFGTSNDEAGWQRSIDVDLLGTVRAIRAAVPHLEQSEAGSIINI